MVYKLTDRAVDQLAPIQQRMANMVLADPRLPELEAQYRQRVNDWQQRMERLGVSVHGLWQLGFDYGEGWYSWQYPERYLCYHQEYAETFESRRLMSHQERKAASRATNQATNLAAILSR